MMIIKAFLVGGAICAIGEVLLLKTRLTTARILVAFVVAGAILSACGLYEPLVKWSGMGASIPISGFGHSLTQGAQAGVNESGLIGAFTGGITQTAAGISAAVLFGYINAIVFKPKAK